VTLRTTVARATLTRATLTRATLTRAALTLIVAMLSALPLLAGGCGPSHPMDEVGLAPVGSLAKAWSFPLKLDEKGDAIRGVYLRGDTLFVYSQRNLVVAFNAAGGTVNYAIPVTPDSVSLKPPILIRDQHGFPAGSTIEMYTKAGKFVESVDCTHSIRSPGTPHNMRIYLGLDYPMGGRLAAIDLTRKYDRAIWELMTFGGVSAAPAVYQNTIYCGSEDGRVYAISEDRLPVWPLEHSAFETDGPIKADVKADESGVYVASMDTKFYCLELGSGKLKWQYYAAAPLLEAPVVTGNSIYLVVPNNGIVALNKTEGKFNREPRWIAKGAKRFLSEDEKNCYLMSDDNHIVAYDKNTGEVKYRSKRNDLIAFAINTNPKDSTIYGATANGEVFAIKPVNKPGTVGTMVEAPAQPMPRATAVAKSD
jgi:outer membrane protein assembly factor BamB